MSTIENDEFVDYPSTDDIERIKKDKEKFEKAKKMSFVFSVNDEEIKRIKQLPEEEYDKLIEKNFADRFHRFFR